MIRDACGLLSVVGEIDLKIGKQRGRFAHERAQTRDRHPADLELRALATSQLEHRAPGARVRSEEHTSELQSPCNLVCRLLLEKKKKIYTVYHVNSGSSVAT